MTAPHYECERYLATAKSLRSVLEKYGVAIIPSVLTEKECQQMVSGMWDTLEHITQNFDPETTPGPISRENKDSWRSFYELFPLHSMLVQHHQIGHAQYIWNLRQNPKILRIWSSFWSNVLEKKISPEELLVSFDGASYHFPPEV